MAGLLNPKTRVLDSIITNEGRRQASSGQMRIEFVSFSDAGAIYALDTLVSGGLDFTSRLTFEAGNLPQDQITFEVDDSGKIIGFFVSGNQYTSVAAGNIQTLTGSNFEIISGSQFASSYTTLLQSTLENYKKLSILQSPDPIFQAYNDFQLNVDNVSFKITPRLPIPANERPEQPYKIDQVESLFLDKRLSHVPNFQFLPPVNKSRIGGAEKVPLGNYVRLNQAPILTYEQLEPELNQLKETGYCKVVEFEKTSRQNNLFCQFFETANNQITKLDVIDFGEFPIDDNDIIKHVFFVGKVFTDGDDITTFVNMFTLVFEK
jgi:hypothetical protein